MTNTKLIMKHLFYTPLFLLDVSKLTFTRPIDFVFAFVCLFFIVLSFQETAIYIYKINMLGLKIFHVDLTQAFTVFTDICSRQISRPHC